MEQSIKNLVNAQTRVSMGIFGEFNVTVSQPIITDQLASQSQMNKIQSTNMNHTMNAVINVGGGVIKGHMVDRNSMISIKDTVDVLAPLSSKRGPILDTSLEQSLNALKEIRKGNATTTNRSRLSNFNPSNYDSKNIVNGEVNMTHSSFKNSNFLT